VLQGDRLALLAIQAARPRGERPDCLLSAMKVDPSKVTLINSCMPVVRYYAMFDKTPSAGNSVFRKQRSRKHVKASAFVTGTFQSLEFLPKIDGSYTLRLITIACSQNIDRTYCRSARARCGRSGVGSMPAIA
jgi:hypothetical protein